MLQHTASSASLGAVYLIDRTSRLLVELGHYQSARPCSSGTLSHPRPCLLLLPHSLPTPTPTPFNKQEQLSENSEVQLSSAASSSALQGAGIALNEKPLLHFLKSSCAPNYVELKHLRLFLPLLVRGVSTNGQRRVVCSGLLDEPINGEVARRAL